MIPSDIGPHPDGPDGHYHVFKGPPSMDSDCGDLAIRLNMTPMPADPPSARHTYTEGEHDVYLGFCAEWMPTDRERELIAAGQPIRVNILGSGLPPSMVWVKEFDEI